jgi:inner membrane protein
MQSSQFVELYANLPVLLRYTCDDFFSHKFKTRVPLVFVKLKLMTARTHDLAAISALGIVVVLTPLHQMTLATALVALLANQLGGIAPDIDQPTAPFWRNLPVGHYFGKVFGKMLGGHRFITHSLLGVALSGFGVYWLLSFLHPIMPNINIDLVWWAFIIGMLSHLLLDTFTKEGVPWLLPVPIKIGLPPVKAWRVTTGKWLEKFIVVLIIGFDIVFFALNYDQLLAVIGAIYR